MRDALCQDCFCALEESPLCPHCGYDNALPPKPVQQALPPFTVLHQRYRLGHTLGAGGFGITYVAFDMLRNVKCAVKEYFPANLAERDTATTVVTCRGSQTEYQHGLGRFFREAQTLGTLHDCEAIVSVWDFFKERNSAYMVMEFVQGNDLKTVMQKNGRIPYEQAYEYLLQCARALGEIHKKGIVHRDISPDNIILLPDNRIKLLDFGAARLVWQDVTSNVVFLKREFAPPEQYAANGKQGPWTDVYALACTFYKLITGTRIPEAAQRNDGIMLPPLIAVNPHIPRHVSNAFETAMAIPIASRFQTMDAFLSALHGQQSRTPRPVPKASPAPQPRPVPAPPRPQPALAHAKAEMLTGPHAGKSVSLPCDTPVRAGRTPAYCELVPSESPSISRIHCVLTYHADSKSVDVQDNSTNGTYLMNGTRLPYGKAYPLHATQTICLASTQFQIKVVIP
ncbi:MAG: FHA domain-containing serine/threonine-protein kinase [Clostridia bacterium]|nr:FHA domain-containing serine/threonine-protein kinase [Clostridia bacterium]